MLASIRLPLRLCGSSPVSVLCRSVPVFCTYSYFPLFHPLSTAYVRTVHARVESHATSLNERAANSIFSERHFLMVQTVIFLGET